MTRRQSLILRELDRLGESGGLTGTIAVHLYGADAPSQTVRRPCKVMAARGLVRRHESNDERWFITEAGRAALASEGE